MSQKRMEIDPLSASWFDLPLYGRESMSRRTQLCLSWENHFHPWCIRWFVSPVDCVRRGCYHRQIPVELNCNGQQRPPTHKINSSPLVKICQCQSSLVSIKSVRQRCWYTTLPSHHSDTALFALQPCSSNPHADIHSDFLPRTSDRSSCECALLKRC